MRRCASIRWTLRLTENEVHMAILDARNLKVLRTFRAIKRARWVRGK